MAIGYFYFIFYHLFIYTFLPFHAFFGDEYFLDSIY